MRFRNICFTGCKHINYSILHSFVAWHGHTGLDLTGIVSRIIWVMFMYIMYIVRYCYTVMLWISKAVYILATLFPEKKTLVDRLYSLGSCWSLIAWIYWEFFFSNVFGTWQPVPFLTCWPCFASRLFCSGSKRQFLSFRMVGWTTRILCRHWKVWPFWGRVTLSLGHVA